MVILSVLPVEDYVVREIIHHAVPILSLPLKALAAMYIFRKVLKKRKVCLHHSGTAFILFFRKINENFTGVLTSQLITLKFTLYPAYKTHYC